MPSAQRSQAPGELGPGGRGSELRHYEDGHFEHAAGAVIQEYDQSGERILLEYLGRNKVALHIAPYVLCVGARLGGEVRSFQSLSKSNWQLAWVSCRVRETLS